MQKFLVFFLLLFMAAGLAMADDEGIGLSVGLEFGIGNVNKADDNEIEPYLKPMIIYGQSFLDDALDISAELDYIFGFTKVPNSDGDEKFPQSLYFDLMAAYNLYLGSASTLSFSLENELDEFIISPRLEDSNNIIGTFTPAVKFTQELDFGDLYAQISVPLTYVQPDKDADTGLGLNFTVGWVSTFGLGLEAKILTSILPGDDAGYAGLDMIISYEAGSIYADVEIIIPHQISEDGVSITPEFDYSLGNFTFYTNCEFAGIGVDGGSVRISPALGAKYSF